MPPVIDHTAFPHILDSILSYAPRDSLIALRAVSREWRDRADAILFRHVVVRDDYRVMDLIVEGPRGERLPLIRMMSVIEKITAHAPNRPCVSSSKCTLSPDRALWNTACLDLAITRRRVTGATMLQVRRALPNVKVIRTAQDDYGHIPLPGFPQATDVVHILFQSMGRFFTRTPQAPAPIQGAKTCVVTLSERMNNLSLVIPRSMELEHVVLIFPFGSPRTPPGFQLRNLFKPLLHFHKEALEQGNPGATYTFVGLFELPPLVHGFGEGTASEMATSFHSWLEDEAQELELSSVPHVNFTSRKKYRKTVGEETWAMATQKCRVVPPQPMFICDGARYRRW